MSVLCGYIFLFKNPFSLRLEKPRKIGAKRYFTLNHVNLRKNKIVFYVRTFNFFKPGPKKELLYLAVILTSDFQLWVKSIYRNPQCTGTKPSHLILNHREKSSFSTLFGGYIIS